MHPSGLHRARADNMLVAASADTSMKGTEMPTITVEGPVIRDIDTKRALARRLTDVAVDVYGIEHVTVLIKENPPENVAARGVLIADLHKKGGGG